MTEALQDERLKQYMTNPSPELLGRVVEAYLPLCRSVARRFRGHGAEEEDLEQVAAMALMTAIRRYNPVFGNKFTTYAVATMTGEIRHYLRDKVSLIRTSRDVRSRLHQFQQVQDRLYIELQREPTINETAAVMGLTAEQLLQLLEMRNAYDVYSLSAAADADALSLEEQLGVTDSGYDAAELRAWMLKITTELTPAEKQLVHCRYEQQLGQRETARHMNVSQMQVSRMERRMLQRLRSLLEEHTEPST